MLITINLLVKKVVVHVVVLAYIVEISSGMPIIPLVYMDFYVNNYKHCLL